MCTIVHKNTEGDILDMCRLYIQMFIMVITEITYFIHFLVENAPKITNVQLFSWELCF